MTSRLTESQKIIVESARAFAEEFLDPIAADLDRSGIFPKAIIPELAKHGMLGLLISKDSGGTDGGFVMHAEAMNILSGSCPAVGSILNNHAITAYAIGKWGSSAQRQKYLPAFANGEKLGALAVYENGPHIGLGPDALLATESGSISALSGTKNFVRNGGVADVYVVFATNIIAAGRTGQIAYIIDAETSGLSIGPIHATMGLKGCPVADVSFKDVIASDELRLASNIDGFEILTELLSLYSLGEAAQAVGIGKAAAEHAVAAAKRRIQFGHPIATLEAIQSLLAEIATDTHLAWLGVQHAAQAVDDHLPFIVAAAKVKSFLGRFGQKLLVDAIQIEGGLGICEAVPKHIDGTLPLARMFRDIAGTLLLESPADFPDQIIAESI
jgi:alkylation response protein AidB-like acyl-CoA dehydrogenase